MGFADRMNNMPKYVVSTTFNEAAWNNSTIIGDHLSERVSRFKQQPGGDMLVAGSCTLTQSLMTRGLIDEYRLLVYPVILGSALPATAQATRIEYISVDCMIVGVFLAGPIEGSDLPSAASSAGIKYHLLRQLFDQRGAFQHTDLNLCLFTKLAHIDA